MIDAAAVAAVSIMTLEVLATRDFSFNSSRTESDTIDELTVYDYSVAQTQT